MVMTKCGAHRPDGVRKLLLLAVALVSAVPMARSQMSAAARAENTIAKLPEYDVVSIKLNKSGSTSVDVDSNIDTYAATNITVEGLIEDAYGIKKDLISGVQGPISSARFDVVAKIVEPDVKAIRSLTVQQRRSMLLPFLVERFHLKAHTEIKILPVFELVVLKSGPKFKQTADGDERGADTSVQGRNRVIELTGHDISMTSLANTLTGQVHRTVIDKTGLAGNYDFAMRWSSDNEINTEKELAPSIFTALQEQLGLKLKPSKGPVETLVVDHVEMPSEN